MRWVVRLAAVLTLAGVARGEPYWIAYEADGVPTGNTGDFFPEDQGWAHVWEGTPERWLEDGVLTYDSLFDDGVYDFSRIEMPGQIDPDPGEVFVCEWGLTVETTISYADPEVALFSDEAWGVSLVFTEFEVHSVFEGYLSIPIAPGVPHAYRVVSADMRDYDLYVDDQLAHHGECVKVFTESYLGWGDSGQGAASLHHWDYFRFGVVPEPATAALIGLSVVVARSRT